MLWSHSSFLIILLRQLFAPQRWFSHCPHHFLPIANSLSLLMLHNLCLKCPFLEHHFFSSPVKFSQPSGTSPSSPAATEHTLLCTLLEPSYFTSLTGWSGPQGMTHFGSGSVPPNIKHKGSHSIKKTELRL